MYCVSYSIRISDHFQWLHHGTLLFSINLVIVIFLTVKMYHWSSIIVGIHFSEAFIFPQLIEAEWRKHASVIKAIIDSANGFHLISTRPLSEPMLAYDKLDHWEQMSVKFGMNTTISIKENANKNVVCNSGIHIDRPRCVNWCFRWQSTWAAGNCDDLHAVILSHLNFPYNIHKKCKQYWVIINWILGIIFSEKIFKIRWI